MLSDKLHESLGSWLLKREDEARVGSHKRFVLDRAYESYLLKQSRYYLVAASIIYLVMGIVFNDMIAWLLGAMFFLITGVIVIIAISERDIRLAEGYARDYVDKRLGRGQYDRMIKIIGSRKNH